MRIWDFETGTLRHTICAHPFYQDNPAGGITALALSPDAKLVYSSGREAEQGRLVKVWDSATGRYLRTVARTPDDPRGFYDRIIPLAAGNAALLWTERKLACWDLRQDKCIWKSGGLSGQVDALLAASPDGRVSLTEGPQGLQVRGPKGDELHLLLLPTPEGDNPSYASAAAAILPPETARCVSAGNDGELALWDLRQGRLITYWKNRDSYFRVNAIAVSDDGKHALVGSDGGALRLWNLTNGTDRRLPAFSTTPHVAGAAR